MIEEITSEARNNDADIFKNWSKIVDCPPDHLASHKKDIETTKREIIKAFDDSDVPKVVAKIIELDKLFQKDGESLLDRDSLQKIAEFEINIMTGVTKVLVGFIIGLCGNKLEIKITKTGAEKVTVELVKGDSEVYIGYKIYSK
ncbi:MAG TPA: hypothetical protein DEB09_03110 [Candidatus Magasanikbacteria bacterium]|nr:hypothetical protein [Candidatus Magasanikbacteria bacterium]